MIFILQRADKQAILRSLLEPRRKKRHLAAIAFIDLEASGLSAQSWPIEVGWCFGDGPPKAYLVRPQPDWDTAAWDKKAEALHGLSYEILTAEGAAPMAICKILNEALADRIVYSDAPDWDGFWLYQLYKASGLKQSFTLTDFHTVLAGFSAEKIDCLIEEAARIAPHRHRAEDDVLHMRTLHRLAARRE